MTLLGRWNWWAPAPLRWLHERIGLREHPLPDGAVADEPAPGRRHAPPRPARHAPDAPTGQPELAPTRG
jgi:hypothetical protein